VSAVLQRRLLALPVDARPVVCAQVQSLVATAGWELQVPDAAALGHFRRSADRDGLAQWLRDEAGAADAWVLSLDMLVYGGLVPSRFIEDPLPSLLARLALLCELRAAHPGRLLYAFAATMRISNNDVADEEKTCWAQYGRLLWRWSFESDRAEGLRQQGLAGEAEAAEQSAAAAAAAIPLAVRQDYQATRERNFQVNLAALQAVADGVVDRLVLPQDDTAAWGFNIAERRALQSRVQALGLQDRVLIYPGADEVLHTLCAHAVQRLQAPRGGRPLRVALAPSDPAHIGQLRALYEDRPLTESIARQIDAVGAVLVADDEQADVLLAVHSQGCEQGDWAMQKPLPRRVAVDSGWFARMHAAAQRGQPVVLADLAFANGGDPWLLSHLEPWAPAGSPCLPPLFSYAGWNTASNSLGGALAHAVLAHVRPASDDAAARGLLNQQICALRLLEDGLYQAQWRQMLRGCADESGLDPAALEALAQSLILPWANAFATAMAWPWQVTQLSFPWGRSFEIDLRLESR